MGVSFSAQRPVVEMIRERFGVSLALNALALTLMVLAAVPLGILGAWNPEGPWDRGGWIATTALHAIPVFWVAILLQWLFAVRLGWLPLSGVSTDGAEHGSVLGATADTLRHLVL